MRLRILMAVLLATGVSSFAFATFHDIKVKEVFAGSAAHPNAQYVLIQAFFASQNSLTGHSVLTFDAAGAPTGTFTFPGPVSNGANQMTVLVATPDAAAIFNLTADLAMTAVLSPAGGKACWDGSTPDDCFAWGNYTGSATGVGEPYNAGAGLIPGYAARRRTDICMTANLDACDDTDDSASDFITVVPDPITNPGVHGTTPPSTCANGALEGLERCDDNNTTDGDGCSAICRIEPDPLTPASLAVDTVDGATSDGNGVFEPGETVQVEPGWTNGGATGAALSGQLTNFLGAANFYFIINGGADYGTIAPSGTGSCADTADCYTLSVPVQARPSLHWDPTVDEILSTAGQKTWTIHIGDSFTDVPRSSLFYPFIENILHNGVTGGCGADTYCGSATTLRKQMAVFLLKSLLGPAYTPPPPTGIFDDVPPDGFRAWIEDLYGRGITGGCAGGPPPAPISYCPDAEVKRTQMAVFLLKTKLGSGYTPPAATGIFDDVPADGFQPWIEDLYNRQITGGCAGGPPPAPISYCPENPVTRGQMSAFLVKTFGLLLYGP
jgi:cysteine-rich repeat protein